MKRTSLFLGGCVALCAYGSTRTVAFTATSTTTAITTSSVYRRQRNTTPNPFHSVHSNKHPYSQLAQATGQQSSPQERAYRSLSSLWSTIDDQATTLSTAVDKAGSDLAKTCRVEIGKSSTSRLGLIAKQRIKKGDAIVAMAYEDSYVLTGSLARKTVLKDYLPEDYEGWTGDAGLIALLILNEVAKASDGGKLGIAQPKRNADIDAFMRSWVSSLPSPEELKQDHPLMWPESDQEVLQSSSTTKIYQSLDDLEEDATWLKERVWEKDRDTAFPETVSWNVQTIPCYTVEGYKWAMALANSRSVFVDGALRLIPLMDFCNHNDKAKEVESAFLGAFGTLKGAQIVASKDYEAGEEVFCSYGPKSGAEYLLDHGFCPPQVWRTAVSELTFEIEQDDRFYDDKIDILEFETYDLKPMDPVQTFDVVSGPGQDGEPDPALLQFVRLCKLGGTDAFLLESIFRSDVWGFMSLPVSEMNEDATINTIIGVCKKALDEMDRCPEGGPEVCAKLRESEAKALKRTTEFLQREKEALDLKEYYQQRRLKDLGLDSEWVPDDDDLDSDTLGFGQTRLPGGADYDW